MTVGCMTTAGQFFTATSGGLSHLSNLSNYSFPPIARQFMDLLTVPLLDSFLSKIYRQSGYSRFQINLLPKSASVTMSQRLFGESFPECKFDPIPLLI